MHHVTITLTYTYAVVDPDAVVRAATSHSRGEQFPSQDFDGCGTTTAVLTEDHVIAAIEHLELARAEQGLPGAVAIYGEVLASSSQLSLWDPSPAPVLDIPDGIDQELRARLLHPSKQLIEPPVL